MIDDEAHDETANLRNQISVLQQAMIVAQTIIKASRFDAANKSKLPRLTYRRLLKGWNHDTAPVVEDWAEQTRRILEARKNQEGAS